VKPFQEREKKKKKRPLREQEEQKKTEAGRGRDGRKKMNQPNGNECWLEIEKNQEEKSDSQEKKRDIQQNRRGFLREKKKSRTKIKVFEGGEVNKKPQEGIKNTSKNE